MIKTEFNEAIGSISCSFTPHAIRYLKKKQQNGCHVNFAVNFTEELLKLFVSILYHRNNCQVAKFPGPINYCSHFYFAYITLFLKFQTTTARHSLGQPQLETRT